MTLLKWALIILAISVVAGIYSFTGVSAAAAFVAQLLFFVVGAVAVAMLIMALTIFKA